MYEAVWAYEAESTLPSKYEAVSANVAYEALSTTIEPVSFDVITLYPLCKNEDPVINTEPVN
jgi:hypothetical protein